MNSVNVSRAALFVLLIAAIAVAADLTPPGYQKGTITQQFSFKHKSYDLKDGDNGYQINDCGDFQNGQVVDYRVKDNKVYIRRENGQEYKCAIEGELRISDATTTHTYQKGTIEGFDTQRHYTGNNTFRNAKVYELRGPDMIYRIDYCGSFQAGKFVPGQVVEYRVDGNRLYIRHDNNEEYNCKIEGKRKAEIAGIDEGTRPDAVPRATPAASVAKLSITSVPDGADIEVDGNFSGNTPSDLGVAEGEHSIAVKKTGYKNWERKIKVVAGSSIHLNAEMEKTTNP